MKIKYVQKLKKISEKIVDPLIKFVNFPAAYIAGRSENLEKAILRPVIYSYSKHSRNHFIQYTTLPKNFETIPVEWPSDGVRFADYAIILQGPVRTEDDFTLNTVRYYKRCYPGAKVIVSTWAESDKKARSEILGLGGIWVESQKPEYAGNGNVNLQLKSSLTGMIKARDIGCKFALKTRTDQRILSNDVLQYFRNLQEAFPSGDPNVVSQRLVFISEGYSYRHLPFEICDFVAFGETNELIKLYGINMDNMDNHFQKEDDLRQVWDFDRTICTNMEVKGSGTPYELFSDFEEKYYSLTLGERYIIRNYFCENICRLHPGDDLLDAYYYYLKMYAVIADSEKVMIYWPKYLGITAERKNDLAIQGRMNFKNWLEIYLHYRPKQVWGETNGSENG